MSSHPDLITQTYSKSTLKRPQCPSKNLGIGGVKTVDSRKLLAAIDRTKAMPLSHITEPTRFAIKRPEFVGKMCPATSFDLLIKSGMTPFVKMHTDATQSQLELNFIMQKIVYSDSSSWLLSHCLEHENCLVYPDFCNQVSVTKGGL